MFQKIKTWLTENQNDVALGIGVFLIAVIAFGMGILVKTGEKTPIIVENPQDCATSSVGVLDNPQAAQLGAFVASKNSQYYHLPSCPGARNISEANKIWFQTREEVESRGFRPASNCPGLKTGQ